MGLEKKTTQIGEFAYEVTQLGAKDGNRVLMKIAKSVGPLFVLAGGGASLNAAKAAEAVAGLSEDDFAFVVDTLAKKTDVTLQDGKSPSLAVIFDLHFAGRYEDELAWLEFAIEVNFGPFFRGLLAKAAAARGAATPTRSSSTSPST